MRKNKTSPIWKLSGVVMVIAFSGCAAAYHDYPDSCIPYLYCVPPPLPYVAYESCHCPTPGASRYSQQQSSIAGDAAPDSDVSAEDRTPLEQEEAAVPVPE